MSDTEAREQGEKTPLWVSVVVPTYNRAHLLGRALRSIFAQSYRNLQLIVVDDGSVDDTESVVAGFIAEADFPVRYVKKENGGCSSARNLGVSLATGDAVAFLDSDDEWLPDAIRNMVERLEETGADFVYSPSFAELGGKRYLVEPAAAGRPELFAVEYFMSTRTYVCSLLYRREIFDRYRNDETLRYNEDSDFLQRVAISFSCAYVGTPTALVHYHSGNKSSNRVEINRALLKSAENTLAAFPDFKKRLGRLAEKRVSSIVGELAGELIAEQRFAEAAALQEKYQLGFTARLSIRMRTPYLFRIIRNGRAVIISVAGVGARILRMSFSQGA